MKLFLTGMAGFIGFHCAKKLAAKGFEILGWDNLNAYYDPILKKDRLRELRKQKNIWFLQGDLEDQEALKKAVKDFHPDVVLHLAAQAGIRYSLESPQSYIQSNLVGFGNILELCKELKIEHLIYASSSSIYGLNSKIPFSVDDRSDQPMNLYAATKKSNELMAFAYSHLYGIRTTGLRFFTVYGPWGRPDMAYFQFTRAILLRQRLPVYHFGKMRRDFTAIDDIVVGIEGALENSFRLEASGSRLYNLGNHQPVELIDFIHQLENIIGHQAQIDFLPLQPGDIVETFADIKESHKDLGFFPSVSLQEGLDHFVSWYKSYYKV